MALEPVPWMVDGGEHSAEVGRLLAYAATGGSEGVIGPTDCKVTASAVPDGNVHIAVGGVAMLNRFPGGGQQSYLVRNLSDTVVALDAQGSSGGRYDVVGIIVEDPEYAGQPDPASVPDGPYVRAVVYKNVPSTTTKLSQVDADQTGYLLARVHFDASDGTVTAADITDLREMSQARTQRLLMLGMPDANLSAPAIDNTYRNWGNYAPTIKVPEWATKIQVSADISGLLGTGQSFGEFRVLLGALANQEVSYDVDSPNASRYTFNIIYDADVRALQGQSLVLQMQHRMRFSSPGGSNWQNIFGTSLRYDIQFSEAIV